MCMSAVVRVFSLGSESTLTTEISNSRPFTCLVIHGAFTTVISLPYFLLAVISLYFPHSEVIAILGGGIALHPGSHFLNLILLYFFKFILFYFILFIFFYFY